MVAKDALFIENPRLEMRDVYRIIDVLTSLGWCRDRSHGVSWYMPSFAGPGEYAGGEAGSPIIALDTALGFRPPLTAKVHFLFVEEREDRAAHLRNRVALRALPANFSVIVEGGVTFETAFARRYPSFVRNGRLVPTFAFIDPFGWTGAPFSLVKQILVQRSCEVFVNFMNEEITDILQINAD